MIIKNLLNYVILYVVYIIFSLITISTPISHNFIYYNDHIWPNQFTYIQSGVITHLITDHFFTFLLFPVNFKIDKLTIKQFRDKTHLHYKIAR